MQLVSSPTLERFNSRVNSADIRELIQVDDVMEDDSLRFGPNGGLVFCMEYFANNFAWLEETLGHTEDDYILFDCPGDHVLGVPVCSAGLRGDASTEEEEQQQRRLCVHRDVERRVSCVGRSD